jgi:microcystin-dependent protein
MDYHGITSIGKIYLQRVSTLPTWSLTDIARILYTNDNANFYLGGDTEWREIIDGVSEQTIVGIKTFISPPLLSRDPSGSDEAVRLSYLEANYTQGTIDLTNYVTLDTSQLITGLKVFTTNLPESNVAPTDNDDLTNKLYVDTIAPKVLVTSTDSTMSYLWDKLTGGDGIALAKMGADGANQQIRISVTGLSGGNFYSDLPIGTIIKFAGSSSPAGYLECDGAAVSRSTYSDLFNVIGEDYGIGNGTTTFNIPSCSGDDCGGEMWCIKYSESEAVNGVDEKVKVSSDDTTAGYLEQKILAGSGITLTTGNAGANETYTISSAAGASSTGMWLKSTGGNNCTVKPGSVAINNVIYSLSTEQSLTLSGYLRGGEAESPSKIYYLYAIGASGSVPTFQFSATKPTWNKYGTTVSFEEECNRSELYHPAEGLTWRYIGEVYNNSSSNIVAFDKMYPGYWESNWSLNPFWHIQLGTSLTNYNWTFDYSKVLGSQINHGLGIVPIYSNIVWSRTNTTPHDRIINLGNICMSYTLTTEYITTEFQSYSVSTTAYQRWDLICNCGLHTVDFAVTPVKFDDSVTYNSISGYGSYGSYVNPITYMNNYCTGSSYQPNLASYRVGYIKAIVKG